MSEEINIQSGLQEQIYKFLELSGEPEALSALVVALDENSALSRDRAAKALLGKKDQKGNLAILKHIHHISPELLLEVKSEPLTFCRVSTEALRGADRQARLNAMNFLGDVGAAVHAISLSAMLSLEDEGLREAAIDALDRLIERVQRGREADKESRLSSPSSDRKLILGALEDALRQFSVHRSDKIVRIALRFGGKAHSILFSHVKAQDGVGKALFEIIEQSPELYGIHFLMNMFTAEDSDLEVQARLVLSQMNEDKFVDAFLQFVRLSEDEHLHQIGSRFIDIPFWPILERNINKLEAGFLIRFMKMISGMLDARLKIQIASAVLGCTVESAKTAALDLLAQVGTKQAFWKMAIVFQNHSSESVQLHAVHLVRSSGIPDKIKILTPLMNSPLESLRAIVVKDVSKESMKHYLASFDKLNRKTREDAARAIMKIDQNVIDEYLREIEQLDDTSRLKAVQIIQLLDKDRESADALMLMMKDADKKVRATIVKSLGVIGSPAAIKALIAALNDPDRRVRANAVEAFADVKHPKVIELVKPFARDPDNRIRGNALRSLWSLGYRDILGYIAEMLLDSDPIMRRTGIWLLGEIKVPQAPKLLRDLLKHEMDKGVINSIRNAVKKIKVSMQGKTAVIKAPNSAEGKGGGA